MCVASVAALPVGVMVIDVFVLHEPPAWMVLPSRERFSQEATTAPVGLEPHLTLAAP